MNHPLEISLFATNKCNYNCWFCKRTFGELNKTEDMNLAYVALALQKYPSIKSACIAGFGEPLLYKDLNLMVEMLKSRGLFISLITNGSLVSNNHEILSKIDVDSISVSLNSKDQETYEKTHGVSLPFAKVICGINWMYEKLRAKINVSFVVSKLNYHHIPDYIKLGMKCDTIDFYNLLPHNKDKWNLVIKQKNESIIDQIEAYKEEFKNDSRVRNWPVYIDYRKEPGKCQLCNYHMLLSPDGYVSCCARVMPPTDKDARISGLDPFNSISCYEIRSGLKSRRECLECFGNYE